MRSGHLLFIWDVDDNVFRGGCFPIIGVATASPSVEIYINLFVMISGKYS